MREENYSRLPAQGNIYSTARLGNISLIGTGTFGKVYAHKSKEVLEELTLADLPKENADIISVDAYDDPFPVVGVTYVDTTNSTLEDETKPAYLQIYSSAPSSKFCGATSETQEPDATDAPSGSGSSSCPSSCSPVASFNYSRPVVDQNVKDKNEYICKQLEFIGAKSAATVLNLNFIPYHLCHIAARNVREEPCTLFLLSGSDRRIHTYEPNVDEANDTVSYAEVPTKNYFPEFPTKFENIVSRIAIECMIGANKRVTVCGCEDGTLLAYIVIDSSTPRWESAMDESVDSDTSTTDVNSTSVTSLPEDNLLTDKERAAKLTCSMSLSLSSESKSQFALDDNIIRIVNRYSGMITCIQFYTVGLSTNLAVSSSASPVYHYTNILEEKFSRGSPLKFSSKWDCVQAVCVADIDFDGQNEILVGTFASSLLVYKYYPDVENWVIVRHRKFPRAIYSISFFDFYIHVVTARGLHLMEFSDASHYLKYGLIVDEDKAQKFTRDYKLEKSLEDLRINAIVQGSHDQ